MLGWRWGVRMGENDCGCLENRMLSKIGDGKKEISDKTTNRNNGGPRRAGHLRGGPLRELEGH